MIISQPVTIPAQGTADYCMARWAEYAAYPALECSLTGKRLTYAEVQDMTQRFGTQLLDSGLQPGDRQGGYVAMEGKCGLCAANI